MGGHPSPKLVRSNTLEKKQQPSHSTMETGKKVCSFSETCTAIVPHDWTPSDRCPDHTCPCTSGIEDGPHCLIDKWCIGDEPLTKKCNKCVRYVCREPLCHGRKCKCGEVINNR